MMGVSSGQQLRALRCPASTGKAQPALTRFQLQLAALVPCHRLTAAQIDAL